MNKNHYIYKITDPLTDEYYIGVRTSKNCIPEEDDYMGSYCSWNPEDEGRLQKEIIAKYPTRQISNSFERKLLILKLKVEKDDKCMNVHIPGIGFHSGMNGKVHSKISKDRISSSMKLWWSDNIHSNGMTERNAKISSIMKNWWNTTNDEIIKERNDKIKISRSGSLHTKKSKEKMSKSTNEWWNNVDKISLKNRNKKISIANSGKNNPMYGMTGSLNPNSKSISCECHSVNFNSMIECAEYHNKSYRTVYRHCYGKSENPIFILN